MQSESIDKIALTITISDHKPSEFLYNLCMAWHTASEFERKSFLVYMEKAVIEHDLENKAHQIYLKEPHVKDMIDDFVATLKIC